MEECSDTPLASLISDSLEVGGGIIVDILGVSSCRARLKELWSSRLTRYWPRESWQ